MLRAPVRPEKEDSLPRPEQVPAPSHAESGEVAGEPRPDAGPGAGARRGRGRSVTRKWRRRRACGSGGRGAVRSSRHGRRRPLCVPRAGPGRPRLARPAGPPLTRPDSNLGARRAGPASLLLHFPSPLLLPPGGRAAAALRALLARSSPRARPPALAPEPACLPAVPAAAGSRPPRCPSQAPG